METIGMKGPRNSTLKLPAHKWQTTGPLLFFCGCCMFASMRTKRTQNADYSLGLWHSRSLCSAKPRRSSRNICWREVVFTRWHAGFFFFTVKTESISSHQSTISLNKPLTDPKWPLPGWKSSQWKSGRSSENFCLQTGKASWKFFTSKLLAFKGHLFWTCPALLHAQDKCVYVLEFFFLPLCCFMWLPWNRKPSKERRLQRGPASRFRRKNNRADSKTIRSSWAEIERSRETLERSRWPGCTVSLGLARNINRKWDPFYGAGTTDRLSAASSRS